MFVNQDKPQTTSSVKSGSKDSSRVSVPRTESTTSSTKKEVEAPASVFSINTPLNDLYPGLPSNYKLLSILGEGAFSIVYKAVDINQPQELKAIKVINKANLTNKQMNNIKNEINIMKKVRSHDNLLTLYDYFDTRENCFLILEYCDGGEVFNKIIEYTYFSEQLSKHVFKQLLTAVEFLHSQNIVHRDIKPENLLFIKIPYFGRPTEDFKQCLRESDDESKIDEGLFVDHVGGGTIGVVKLADFGLAKQLPKSEAGGNIGHTNLKTPCGTAGYTAPEVITCNATSPGAKKRVFTNDISKRNYYSKSVDIWSLGCLLYTILCGFPPFYDDDPSELTSKILQAKYKFLKPWWDEISEDAKDLISKMLVVNPEERITIQEIWEHPWVKDQSNDTTTYFNANQYVVKNVPFNSDNNLSLSTFDSKKDSSTEHIEYADQVNPPLKSPRAEAIKKVFDNPAMMDSSVSSFVSGVDATAHIVSGRSGALPFIENIAEEYETDEGPIGIRNSISSLNKVRLSIDDDSALKQSSGSDVLVTKVKKKLPRTPNPGTLDAVNFKDIFNVAPIHVDYDDEEDDDDDDDDDSCDPIEKRPQADLDDKEDFESETNDEVTSLTSRRLNLNTSRSRVEDSFLTDASELSSNSLSEDDHDEDDVIRNDNDQDLTYQTRSSSIISGINGDFKFTLNLNESSLLTRRRSSTVGKSLKKYQSNASGQGGSISPSDALAPTVS